jgi:hypothetical protein
MNYETWRISYQSSEQAARAAWEETQRIKAICMRVKEALYFGAQDPHELADKLEGVFRP